MYPIREMVNGIINKTTVIPKIFKKTGESIFEAIYTPLTAKLKTTELPAKRMSWSLYR
jgi:hypothetical protein